jgi:L-histidine N-alpha-methyltransferase
VKAQQRNENTLAADVRKGLIESERKALPPRLFYDEEGSRLFEAITQLPEYYPTRLERSILTTYADDIARTVMPTVPMASTSPGVHRVHVVELGAGTATKSQIILTALVRRQGRTLYLPIDVSDSALRDARDRLAREEPAVDVRPLAQRHEIALQEVQRAGPRRLVLFIGSSIGNFSDDEAVSLLQAVRGSLAVGGALLLGADRKKSVDVMLNAYNDRQGITAAFNKNVLVRINRELGGTFDTQTFAHRVWWNEQTNAVEMHLESLVDQRVRIRNLGVVLHFIRGETIHTESSAKYTDARLDNIAARAGFARERDYFDADRWYGVHLFRAV